MYDAYHLVVTLLILSCSMDRYLWVGMDVHIFSLRISVTSLLVPLTILDYLVSKIINSILYELPVRDRGGVWFRMNFFFPNIDVWLVGLIFENGYQTYKPRHFLNHIQTHSHFNTQSHSLYKPNNP